MAARFDKDSLPSVLGLVGLDDGADEIDPSAVYRIKADRLCERTKEGVRPFEIGEANMGQGHAIANSGRPKRFTSGERVRDAFRIESTPRAERPACEPQRIGLVA